MATDRSMFYFWGKDSTRKLYVRSCGDFTLVQPDREMERVVDFAEIFWPISGRCHFHDKNDCILHPGSVWYYPPGSRHNFYPVKTFHYCFLTIAGGNASKLFESLDIKPGLNKAGPCPHQLFSYLGNELLGHSAKHKLSALSVAIKILIEVGLYPPKDNQSKENLFDAKKRIETDFGNPDLDVRMLAESLHMHPGSFSRAFHKTFDMTVMDYISMVRIKNAIDMLSSTEYSIMEIAEECGFHSGNYFSKFFSSQVGISPTGYRNKKYAWKKDK